MKAQFHYWTTYGVLSVTEEHDAITTVSVCDKYKDRGSDFVQKETPLIVTAYQQLTEYFAGQRQSFQLPLMPNGTAFQMKVWQALQMIPYGETRSYLQIAETIGNPKACRAVGMANHHNPIGIIIPCHRVIGANGALVGYAGGLNLKKCLLDLEKRTMMKKLIRRI